MRKLVTILLFTLSLSPAQITISSGDILGVIGQTHIFESDTSGMINISPGPGGENQIWDFSSVTILGKENVTNFLDPRNTAYADSFPGSNFVFTQTDTGSNGQIQHFYGYYDVSTSAISLNGLVFQADSFLIISQANENTAPLPLSYGLTWETVTYDTSDLDGFISYNKDSSYSVVDAWGTITLPAGTFDCLRIRDYSTSISSYYFDGVYYGSDTTESISYDWITRNHFRVLSMESLPFETEPNFSQAQHFERLKSISTTAIAGEGRNLPEDFELRQNYPNPFNPSTTIAYRLARNSDVSLKIYDLSGRLVRTLVQGRQQAGYRQIQWDGRDEHGQNVSSGSYIYKLRAGNISISRRMLLLK